MSFRRRLAFSNRDQFARWLGFVGICICSVAHADPPLSEVKTEIKLIAPAWPDQTTRTAPPANAAAVGSQPDLSRSDDENWELRVAKRPWLLKKLAGPDTEPSRKMDPPRPSIDLSDPPSMSRIVPDLAPSAPLQEELPKPSQQPSFAKVPGHARNTIQKPALNQTPELSPVGDPTGVPPLATVTKQETNPLAQPGQPTQEIISGEIEPLQIHTKVSIRKLQIESDGTPVPTELAEQPIASESVPSRSVEAPSNETYVGDMEVETIDEPAIDETTIDESAPTIVTAPLEGSAPSTDSVPSTESVPLNDLASQDNVSRDYTGHPREQIQLTRDVIRMRGMMQQCLRYYYNRPDNANERSNWGMMHAIMVYGIDTKVIVKQKRYSAIAWIAGNNACRGQKLLTQIDGKIAATNGVGLQGHQGQLLAVLSLAGVPSDYALYGGDRKYSVNDLVEAEMLACKTGEELTFTLIGLSHYVDTDSEWRNADGEIWNFEKLIREELSQPIVGAACGGSHRLMGFAHALRARRAEQLPITGQWKRAEEYAKSFEQYTYRLQNRDGSMSTDWFEGREDNGNLERKIQTTGHMVEWLLTVTPDSELQNPRLVNAIGFLLKSMYEERGKDWEIGPKGHSLRSLAMYYERVYQDGPAWQTHSVARHGNSRQR